MLLFNFLQVFACFDLVFIVTLRQAKMRIGLAEQTVLVALGYASLYSEQLSVTQSRLEEVASDFLLFQKQ